MDETRPHVEAPDVEPLMRAAAAFASAVLALPEMTEMRELVRTDKLGYGVVVRQHPGTVALFLTHPVTGDHAEIYRWPGGPLATGPAN